MDTGAGELPIGNDDAVISVDDIEVDRVLRAVRAQGNRRRQREVIKIEDEDTDEKFDDREILAEAALEAGVEFVDLTDDIAQHSPPRAPIPARNPSFQASYEALEQCVYKGIQIQPGLLVELVAPLGRFTAGFVQVKHILQDRTTSAITIRGLSLARTRYFSGQLERKLNEVCIIYEMDLDDRRSPQEQALVEVPLDNILCLRSLRKTNAAFPAFRFGDTADAFKDRIDIEERALLVCRWTYTAYYRNAALRKAGKAQEWAFSHFQYEDADEGYRTRHALDAWRGGKVRGGSSLSRLPVAEKGRDTATAIPIDTSSDDDVGSDSEIILLRDRQQKYTLADMFSGAGGTSRGAERAGFAVEVAVDHWEPACFSYKRNFRQTQLYQMDVYDFLSVDIKYYTDVLHLSPPCQVWSPAHTIPGQNDSANVAVLFSCQQLIKVGHALQGPFAGEFETMAELLW